MRIKTPSTETTTPASLNRGNGSTSEPQLDDGKVAVPQLASAERAARSTYEAAMVSDIDRVEGSKLTAFQWDAKALRASLTPSDQASFDRLSSEQQKQLVQVVQSFPEAAAGKVPEEVKLLLRSPHLNSRDLAGGRLLDSLSKLATQKLAPGLSRGTIMKEVLDRIVAPEKINQRNRGTCTVTTLEYLLASKKPAEFARLITGLVSDRGVVKLADGSNLSRDSSGLAEDDSGRANIDRIFQSSMMEYSNGILTNYDNKDDKNLGWGVIDEGSGLSRDEIRGAMEAALGASYRSESYFDSPADRATMIKRFQKALAAGKPVAIAIFWSRDLEGKKGYHQLAVTGLTGTHVELWNPWGAGERGQGEPPRQLNSAKGAGHITMTIDELFSRMITTHLPEGY